MIDEAEAEIVRLIFHKYVYEGYGAQKLSHYLYEQGSRRTEQQKHPQHQHRSDDQE
ncbi:recombinase family protein [Faecalibacterium sp. I3-3-33]|nr:recombinase family protein [Faecalibacterium sp. I3-3-33]